MMIGHMLRTPHHRQPAPRLRHAHDDAAGMAAAALAAPDAREGAYYYACAALHAGSVLGTARLATAPAAPAAPAALDAPARPASKTELRSLNTSYDRYALVDELVVPAAPQWPLRLRLSGFALAAPAAEAAGAVNGSRAAPRTPAPPPAVYIGLQAASPPRLRSTLLAKHVAGALSHLACLLLLGMTAAALVGHARGDGRGHGRGHGEARAHDDTFGSDSEADVELLPMATAATDTVTVGVPVGRGVAPSAGGAAAVAAPASAPRVSADGELLSVGSRVQTQHTRARGGDGSWYAGTVLSLHADGRSATVIYDDGEEEEAPLDEVYVLQGDADDEEAARATPAHEAAPLVPQQRYDRSR